MVPTVVVFVFALLIVYQVKHFAADYPLQGRYMLGKFAPGLDFVFPLAAHCAVHAAFTLAILASLDLFQIQPGTRFLATLWWLAIVDFGIHFVMDRIKASPRWLGRFKPISREQFEKNIFEVHAARVRHVPTPYHVLMSFRSNEYFWWSIGFDQMVHHLTHYFIIFKITQLYLQG